MAFCHFFDFIIGKIEILPQFLDHNLPDQDVQIIARFAPHIEQGPPEKSQDIIVIGRFAFYAGADLVAAAVQGNQVERIVEVELVFKRFIGKLFYGDGHFITEFKDFFGQAFQLPMRWPRCHQGRVVMKNS